MGGIPLVVQSILVFAIHDSYVQMYMVLEKAKNRRNTIKVETKGEPFGLHDLGSYSVISLA